VGAFVALVATSATAFSCAPLIGGGPGAGAGSSHPRSVIHALHAGAVNRQPVRIAAVLNANGHGDDNAASSDDLLVGGFFSIFVVCSSLMLWSVCVSTDYVQPITWHAHIDSKCKDIHFGGTNWVKHPNGLSMHEAPKHRPT